MKGLDEAFKAFLASAEMWLRFIARPIATLNDILLESTDEAQLSAAMKVWVPSVLIGAVINIPLLKSYGIDWYDVGYHLSTLMLAIMNLVVFAFIVHRVLLFRKLKSEFVRTLVMFTVVVTIAGPLSNLLTTPTAFHMFGQIQQFKQHSTPFDQALAQFMASAQAPDPGFLAGIKSVATYILFIVSLGAMVLFAEAISQWYGNDRFKSYSSVFGAQVITALFTFVVQLPMQILIIHAFIGKAAN